MIRLLSQTVQSLPEDLGFRTGEKGVHNTRTMMFDELETLMEELPDRASREDIRDAIVDHNVLAKNTDSTRRYTARRLFELYGLDPGILTFRTFRQLWKASDNGRSLLAMLLALARDPILRMTAEYVLCIEKRDRYDKTEVQEILSEATGDRFSETSIQKISRMTGSSWTQSGHLDGRYKKVRQRPTLTPADMAYALLLGYMCGVQGELLFDTFWTQVLDAPDHELHEQAKQASKRNLLTYRNAGGIVEIDFAPVLTTDERERIREQN